MTILFPMHRGMTRAAKGLEIIQRVVSQFAWRGNPKPVYVVNMQVVACAAALTGVIVSFKGFDAVPVEAVIVFGLLAILFDLIGVFGGPLSYAGNVAVVLARLALALRPRRILKWLSAIFARKHVPFSGRTNGVTLGSAILRPLDAVVFIFASVTGFLSASRWLVRNPADNTVSVRKSSLGFTVSSQSAGLAPLGVGGRACYSLAAIGAVNLTVGFHMTGSKMIPDLYSGGAV